MHLKVDFKSQITPIIIGNELRVNRTLVYEHNPCLVFDIKKHGLMFNRKKLGFSMADLMFVWCFSSFYYFRYTSPQRTSELLWGGVSLYVGGLISLWRITSKTQIAGLTVKPDQKAVSILMFDETQFDSEIKHCRIEDITSRVIQMRVMRNDKQFTVIIHNNDAKRRENFNLLLFLGICHPDVQRIEYQSN